MSDEDTSPAAEKSGAVVRLDGYSDPPSLPDAASILLTTGLYDRLSFSKSNKDHQTIWSLYISNVKFDAYCTSCKIPSIFAGGYTAYREPPLSEWINEFREFSSKVKCARCSQQYTYYFRQGNKYLIKIGQFPSIEDISLGEIVKFKKLLSEPDYAELKRAGGLYSHGIGIGSFAYLRRIFERLLNSHYDEFRRQNPEIEGWQTMRMDEKIGVIADYLPPALVLHKKAYGILSAGIHALDEAACLRFFPALKSAIVQILQQDLRRREEKEAEEILRKDLDAFASEVRSRR